MEKPLVVTIGEELRSENGRTMLSISGAISTRLNSNLKGEIFQVEIPVDTISIDGKLYYIPRTFFAYDPTEVDEDTTVQDGVTPSVKYVKLDSGVYVPADYMNDTTMKKLEDLNGEYLTFSMMSRLQCEDKCDNFDDFMNVYRKKFITTVEQVRLLVEDLRGKGFKFDAKRHGSTILTEVVGPDGDVGYYMTDRFSRDKTEVTSGMYKGKWAPLAETYSIPIVSGYWEVERGDIDKDQSDVMVCEARVEHVDKSPVFVCYSGDVVIPIRPPKDTEHRYRVLYKKAAKGVYLALTYTQVHDTVYNFISREDISAAVAQKSVMRFGRITRICSLNHHIIDEVIVDQVINADIVLIDNKTAAVMRDDCGELLTVVRTDGTVSPSAKYTTLPSGLYVPTDYIDQNTVAKLRAIKNVKDQAKLLVAELVKMGFKFNASRTFDRYEVDVVGPDGDRGHFRAWQFTRAMCYQGKWSLTGEVYSNLLALNGI